jgi:hypothetical protein
MLLLKYSEEGYCCFKVEFPIYLSSQNLMFLPLFSWKQPRSRKAFYASVALSEAEPQIAEPSLQQ